MEADYNENYSQMSYWEATKAKTNIELKKLDLVSSRKELSWLQY